MRPRVYLVHEHHARHHIFYPLNPICAVDLNAVAAGKSQPSKALIYFELCRHIKNMQSDDRPTARVRIIRNPAPQVPIVNVLGLQIPASHRRPSGDYFYNFPYIIVKFVV